MKKVLYIIATLLLFNITVGAQSQTNVVVDVCTGSTYTINGKEVIAQGEYLDTIHKPDGQDSIVRYVFNVHNRFDHYDTAHICAGETYLYHDTLLSIPGNNNVRFVTTAGCDSVFHLYLYVHDKYSDSTSVTICESDTLFINGQRIQRSGVYKEHLHNQWGCDSIHIYNVTVLDTIHSDERVDICSGKYAVIGDTTVSTTGIYYRHLHTSHGCDSIVKYVVNVHTNYEKYDTAHICDGDVYQYHDSLYTRPGHYRIALQTRFGCDSIFNLRLYSHDKYSDSTSVTICESDTLFINGQRVQRSGVYTDHSQNQWGCDSIHIYNVTVLSTIRREETIDICSGTSAFIGDTTVSTTGIYYRHLYSLRGCDSIVKYMVNVHANHELYDTAHICDGDVYQYHDSLYTRPGNYRIVLQTEYGCDSICNLRLYTHDSYSDSTSIAICETDTLFVDGQRVQRSGVYIDHGYNQWGCDSIHIYNVTVIDTVHSEKTIYICSGGVAVIGDTTVRTTGTFIRKLKTTSGCDSIVKYIVNAYPKHEKYDTAHICTGDVYQYHDSLYTLSGHYRIVLQTRQGCDSIYNLRLYVHDNNYDSTIMTICENDSFYVNGQRVQQSGIYKEHLKNQWGCDSVQIYNVTVIDTVHNEVTLNICHGTSATLGDTVVTTSGTYYRTLYTSHGCDSIVKYTVNFGTPFELFDTAHICEGDIYTYHGVDYGADGNHVLSYKTTVGECDSIYHLRLYVHPTYYKEVKQTICENEYFEVNHRQVVQSGIYYDSTTTIYGCDSITKYEIIVNDTSHSYAQQDICRGATANLGDTLVNTSGTYTRTLRTPKGCDSIVTFSVIVHDPIDVYDTIDLCRGNVYTYHNQRIATGGNHIVSATNKWGCDDTYHLHVRIHDTYFERQQLTICINDNFKINNRQILVSGTYQDTNKTIYGCDSITEYIITVKDTVHTDIHINVCAGSTYTINNKVIAATGTYRDTCPGANGCDSIVSYIFNEYTTHHHYDTLSRCQGDTVIYHGKTFTTTGDHTVHNTTIYGCDSDYHLHLEVHDTVHRDTTITICKDTIFQWNGQRITQPGHYIARYTSIYGCDSVWELNYIDTVPPVIFDTTICQGSVVEYRNRRYMPMSDIRDTLIARSHDEYECDTMHYIHIKIDSIYNHDIDTVVCGKSAFIYNGHRYDTTGIYIDTTLSAHGCPRYTRINLTLVKDTSYYDIVNLCDGDSMVLSNGTIIRQSGHYNDTIYHTRGCPIVYHHTVNFITTSETYETHYVCSSTEQALCAFNNTYYTEGKHDIRQRIPNTNCENICHLNVINLGYYHDTIVYTCWQSMPYVFPRSGKTHFTAGIHYDTIPVAGSNCDSVFRIDLRVDSTHNNHVSYDTAYYCHNNYQWQGMTLTRDSDYTVVYQDQYHCDSILHLHYTTTPPVYYAQLWLCPNTNQSANFHGRQYSVPGLYHDTVYNQIGCPEILDVVVNWKISTIITDSLFVCGPNERKIWPVNGQYYGVGTYDFTYPGDTSRCPDYAHLVVTDESASVTRTVTVCETQLPYTDPMTGIQHYTGGVKNSTVSSRHINGCSHPYTLTLIVDQDNHYYDTYDTVCRGYNYTYQGVTYQNCQNDTVIKTRTQRGLECDSVVTFHLGVINEYDTTYVQICQGTSYTWPVNGKTYTRSIIDNSAGRTYTGCGCTHYDVLVLDVINPVTVGNVNIGYVCACDTATPITITLDGVSRKPDRFSIHFDATGHANGFADKLNSKLDNWDNVNRVATLSTKLPGFTGDSLTYVRPGFYDITLTFDSDACSNQMKAVKGVIEVRYPEWILKQNWDDVVAVLRKNHRDENGNPYEFSSYSWYVNGGIVSGEHDSYLYQEGVHLTTSDYVEAELIRTGEQEAVKTCPLWIVDFDAEDGRQYPIRDPRYWKIVNNVPLQAPQTTFDAKSSGRYYLYTLTGQLIHSATFEIDQSVTVTLPATQSYYMLRIETDEGSAVHKILVY